MSQPVDPEHRPLVAAVVVNWNRPADTARCLRSLLAMARPPDLLIVVDNASADDSVASLGAEFPGIAMMTLAQNRGFCGGYNAGMRRAWEAGADWALLMNDDALAASNMLQALLDAAAGRGDTAFLGPLLYTIEQPDLLMAAGGQVLPDGGSILRSGPAQCGRSALDEDVDFLPGAVLLVRRTAVERIGLLDEDYFAYWEDVDWCQRAARAGWASVVVARATAWHPDMRLRDAVAPLRHYYMVRNQLLLARNQNWSLPRRLRLWARDLRMILSWSLRPQWRDRRPLRYPTLRALWDYRRGYRGEAPADLLSAGVKSP